MGKPYEDLGFAKVDLIRRKRKGFPEVIYCPGKTPQQIAKIAQCLWRQGQSVLATKADEKVYRTIKKILKSARYYKVAKIVAVKNKEDKSLSQVVKNELPKIAIVTAGTADLSVAEEAAVTAEFLGNRVERVYDVGVAGIHRLVKNLDKIKKAKVIIVVAGMEGALPSIVGGLVDKPIIAVPTSVGYGANFKGLSALLAMMNSCAPGVAVVNIDNGFGAGVMAHTILKQK